MQITLRCVDANGNVIASNSDPSFCQLDIRYRPFEPGDRLELLCDETDIELEITLDYSLTPSIVYLASGRHVFPIPFGDDRDPYGQAAFDGDCHWAYARLLDEGERANYRNLACNSCDLESQTACFPHASTNSGATNNRFLARNAIDGIFQTCHHGRWPYESWGINGHDDAILKVDFGRPVLAEELILFLRADFPHDTWWKQATLTCSDGFSKELGLSKTGAPQRFALGRHTIEWVTLSDLVQVEDVPGWPALSQIMVMGRLL